ncbi:MAG: M28 family peptidase, partial [Candidatus Thermoplasmatota archaeon]|nr:M28 family peptidase [Candidatus Thermoplasmatota archaeon]
TEYEGRVTGSDICNAAGDWIYDEFNNMSNLIVRKHFWSARGNIYHSFQRYNGENVIAELPGKLDNNQIFVFSAHYDVSNYNSPGALDNGAGVAVLLTIARTLSEYSFEHTIRFIAFSGEEQGFLGSYSYAKECYTANEQIAGVLNADVIGNNTFGSNGWFPDPNLVRAFSTYPAKWIVTVMSDVCHEYNIPIHIQRRPYFGNSDDKAFDDYGYPVMQLFQSAGGMESFYGTEDDTKCLINFSYLFNVTKCFAAGLAVLSDYPQAYPIVRITNPKADKMYVAGFNSLILSKGRTIVLGPSHVTAFIDNVKDDTIKNITFELIQGRNDNGIDDENRVRIARFNISTPPYEWRIKERCFGWYTLRAEMYNETDVSFSNEVNVFIIR